MIYLTARDEQLGLEALQRLSNRDNVKFHQLDLRSVESIRRLAEHIRKEHDGLDILINNAAMAFKVRRNSASSFDFSSSSGERRDAVRRSGGNHSRDEFLRHDERLQRTLSAASRSRTVGSVEENEAIRSSFSLSVVNVSSRAGMLESVKNARIRHKLIDADATIETISDVLSDFIE